MFKLCVFLCVVAASLAAPTPGAVVAPIAYSAPLVASPLVTAHSSQFISQNFHGVAAPLAAPLVAAPYAAALPYAHAPLAAYAHAPAYYY